MADVSRVLALAPQLEPASFISKLFLFFNFPAVFVRCSLKDSVWSSVIPIHTCRVTVAPARLDIPQSALRPAAIAGPVHCSWCVR